MDQPFSSLRVLEVSGSAAGAYAAKLFVDHGAALTRLESGESLDWQRLAGADVCIESSAPDPLTPKAADPLPERLISVCISPFGSTGPYAAWRSNAFTDDAWGGHLALNGDPDREPLARPGLHAHCQAGLHAFIGALAALRVRRIAGRGQRVEVSHLEGLASMHQHTTAMWTHGHHVLRREGNRQPGYWHPAGIYPCRDGHVVLDLAIAEHRDRFLAVADLPELLVDPRFADDLALGAHKDAFDAAIQPWLLARDRAEIVALLQGARAPAGPVQSFLEVLADPHLKTRDFWRERHGVRVPASPLRIARSEQPANPPGERVDPAHAPRSPLAGLRVLDLTRIWAGPLAGRILADLGADVIVVETPNARGGRSISDAQARDTHLFPANAAGIRPWNRLGSVNEIQRNKRGITLDLKRREARSLFPQLVAACDVMLSSFSPLVVAGLGLDFDDLCRINPQLISTEISGYGAWGPDADRVALGPVIEGASGLAHAMGYPDGGPYRSGVAWADPITGLHAVAGTLIALYARESDPESRGRCVEISMLESLLASCGAQIEAAQRLGRAPARRGNRDAHHAPQGVYPCLGEDRWIALSITSDPEWRSLCRVLQLDPALAVLSRQERQARHDELDAALAARTRTQDRIALCQQLQAARVIAAQVADARDLCEDPQLAARDFWAQTPHPEAGLHPMPGCAIRLSQTPVRYERPAPCLGQHNREVLGELTELDDASQDALEAAGILVDTPP